MKLVISNKEGKARQVEFENDIKLIGLKIGDKIDGSLVGLEGFELELRGGSDNAGFPMRRDVQGAERKRILTSGGTGVKVTVRGMLKKKTVRGNTVSPATAQLNFFALKVGNPEFFNVAKAEKKEEKEEKKKK